MVDGRALVAIIGEGMKNQVCAAHHLLEADQSYPALNSNLVALQIGVAARMFRCLSDAGVNFEMITQGASEINVSVIINAADAGTSSNPGHTRLDHTHGQHMPLVCTPSTDKAIAEIHAEFLEGSEAQELEEPADPAN